MTKWEAFRWMQENPWSFAASAALVIVVLVGAKLTGKL